MKLKALVKSAARRCGFLVVTAGHRGARYVEHPPETPLDGILLEAFADIRHLNFIQVGANDGKRGDPIRKYVVHCRWSGVLVEPVPALFESLKVNYANQQSRLTFLKAAVDASQGTRSIFMIAPETPAVVDWARGVVSFDHDHVARVACHLGLPRDVIRAAEVRTITWDDVYSHFGNRHCDVLVIDAEGYDATLLRLANLATRKPTVIQFEHGALDRAVRLEVYGELLDLGYEIATSFIDTVAYLPPGARAARQQRTGK